VRGLYLRPSVGFTQETRRCLETANEKRGMHTMSPTDEMDENSNVPRFL